jgi:hypothetical protein
MGPVASSSGGARFDEDGCGAVCPNSDTVNKAVANKAKSRLRLMEFRLQPGAAILPIRITLIESALFSLAPTAFHHPLLTIASRMFYTACRWIAMS